MADKYMLRLTAGPSYDESTHVEIPVNRPEPVCIEGASAVVELNVRIRNYDGLPRGSNASSAYFSAEPHAANDDQYSISFRFTPLRPASHEENGNKDKGAGRGIGGADLLFGNDFDRPIRHRLPPGFNVAMSIVKWWIDPGLEGDAYADKPYLYGPALSSFNVVSVGDKAGAFDEGKGGLWFEEGGDGDGLASRRALGAPDDAKARMRWALQRSSKDKWVWEYGRTYGVDFFNPYLDFAKLALRLPGFRLSAVRHLEKHEPGQVTSLIYMPPSRRYLCHLLTLNSTPPRRSHHLRYVLRHRTSGEVYLVVIFSLHLKEDINEDGTLRTPAQDVQEPEAVDDRGDDLPDGDVALDRVDLNGRLGPSPNDVD